MVAYGTSAVIIGELVPHGRAFWSTPRMRMSVLCGAVVGLATLAPLTEVMAADDAYRTRGFVRKQSAEKAAPALRHRGLSVSLLTVDNQKQAYSVPSGSTLYSRERIALEIILSSAAYVYVMYQTEGGPMDILYPADGQENLRLPSGQRLRIPPLDSPYGDVLELDDQTGREQLYVVSSQKQLPPDVERLLPAIKAPGLPAWKADGRPLPQKGGAAKAQRRAERVAPHGGAPVRYPPETSVTQKRKRPRLNRRTRGIVRTRKTGGIIDAQPDHDGIAVVVVEINHKSRQ